MSRIQRHFSSLGPSGFHRLAYQEWGEAANPHVVVCVHGLTRNSRDFDWLAAALERDCRVVCLDVVGRGASDWLENKAEYGYPLYLSDCAALLARLATPAASGGLRGLLARLVRPRRETVLDWVGTSMGGLIGMMLAAQGGCPIRRMVLNDVGPFVPAAALARIAEYVGRDPRCATLEEFEAYLKQICAPFGPLTPEQWRHLALHGHRRHEDGRYGFSYDPGIAVPFRSAVYADVDLWPLWERVRCRSLILRGADSDVLSHDTARRMLERGPRSELVEFAGVGHAPMLMGADQVRVVRDFLLG